ncbi:hypothetical protein ACQKEX_14660 [Bacillus pumilus]|uniref:hypothetical protein n=1 Tax=Bacillus TaxID=1386 RepID=UPI001C21D384|nr:hypothetical protein [Bacillus pumilus]MBU8576428.1 hypothetical protein [Bacillus pumilus]
MTKQANINTTTQYKTEANVGEHVPIPNLDEMDYNELIVLSEAVIKAVRTRSYKNGYDQGRFDAEKSPDLGEVTMELETHKLNRSPVQLKREQIVERAKDDFKKLSTTYRPGCPSLLTGKAAFDPKTEAVDVHVNTDKRAVTVLITYISNRGGKKRVSFRGIAKYMPTECFNVHIGKAIALRRALGLEVPYEYLHAPQPTEVRAGDIIECKDPSGDKTKFKVERVEKGRAYKSKHTYVRLDAGSHYGGLVTNPKTVDDSQEI